LFSAVLLPAFLFPQGKTSPQVILNIPRLGAKYVRL
jgi:hypothetical protein